MKKFKKMTTVLLGMMAAAALSIPAYASVSQISIEVEDVINIGEDLQEPEITINSGDCEIVDIQWSKDTKRWKAGSKVTATLTLETEDSFKSSYNAGTCRVSGANYSSSSRTDEHTLKVRLTYIPRAQLGETEQAGWSSSKKHTAVWKKVPFATAYQLQLFRNGDIVKTLTVTSNSADLSEYMTEEASYSYRVRAIGEADADRYYLLSGEYVESEDIALEDLGQTDGEWKSYPDGEIYLRTDGTSPSAQWEKIGGDWYYFDSNGYKATGWQNVENAWYYLGQDGRMKTGWQETDGKWYFLGEDGRMQTGWIQGTPGIWYYLYEDGSMAVNTVIDGRYPVDQNGQWK